VDPQVVFGRLACGERVFETDWVTVGTQNSITLSATPGQVQTFGADLIVECQGKGHRNSSVTLSYDAAGSNVPPGGARVGSSRRRWCTSR
jgi:hypothetical protein